MATFSFQVEQAFVCTYEVTADTAEEAWLNLLDGLGACQEQQPGPILSPFAKATVQEVF